VAIPRLFFHCEASRKEAVAISTPLSLRGFPKGSRGNLNPSVIARLPERKPWQSLFNEMYHSPFTKYEIATPERFSVQARNDKSIDCFDALLLAKTINLPVIASPPKAGVAISTPLSFRYS
jgi:hypothetical protein